VLFGFRGIRMFQVVVVLATLALGIGGAFSSKAFADTKSPLLLFTSGLLILLFLWMFTTALRAPTSFVAVAPERTRIRFSGFVDTVIDNGDIVGVRLVYRSILGGIGVRTSFRGTVALVSTWGYVAEVTLRRPIRVWLIPKLIPVRATRLQLSINHPAKLVERFGELREQGPGLVSASGGKAKARGSRAR
jgi:hypothetical protein